MKLGKLSVGIATAILLSTSFVGTVDAATYVQKATLSANIQVPAYEF